MIQTDLKEEEHRFKAQSEQFTEWMGTVEKELDQKHENQLATKEKKHEVELNLRKLNKDFEQAATLYRQDRNGALAPALCLLGGLAPGLGTAV